MNNFFATRFFLFFQPYKGKVEMDDGEVQVKNWWGVERRISQFCVTS